jgi:antitoxin ParD1/3/4
MAGSQPISLQIRTNSMIIEYIRDLIRREQERNVEIEAIRHALIEGEESGEPQPFDAAAFKRRMRKAHG